MCYVIYALTVWPTKACNIKCAYCFFAPSEKWHGAGVMSVDTADQVVDFINSGQVDAVDFFGAEPMMNWKIVKRILARSRLGTRPYPYGITTNGTLLDPDVLEYLELHRTRISLSFDGTKITQDHWRDGSYDAVLKNIDLLVKYPSIQVLMTMTDPRTLYEDVEHIKALGFGGVFINLLDAFGPVRYDPDHVEIFKEQYLKVIGLATPGFHVGDYERWSALLKGPRKLGCGFTGRGLGCGPDGKLYPCHQGPSLPEEFCIGDVWNGVDAQKEREVRSAANPPSCRACPYQLGKCLVSMYNKHGKFGVDPPEWYVDYELAKIGVIERLNGLEARKPACM